MGTITDTAARSLDCEYTCHCRECRVDRADTDRGILVVLVLTLVLYGVLLVGGPGMMTLVWGS